MTQALGDIDSLLLANLMQARDPGVRSAALRVAGEYADLTAFDDISLDAQLALAAKSDNARVRLEAVLAVPHAARLHKKTGSPARLGTALSVLDKPTDKVLEYALGQTVRELEPEWMPAFRAGDLIFADANKMAFALSAVGTADAAKPLLKLLADGRFATDRVDAVWLLVARVGGPDDLKAVLDRARDAGTSPQRAALLTALDEAVRQRNVRPAGDLKPMDALVEAADEPSRVAAIRLAGR